MLSNRPVAFVDAAGVAFMELVLAGGGSGHPAQQFLYQPAVDRVLREGVDRFGNVEVLVQHECLRVRNDGDHVDLMLADLCTDELRRVRASYVIAADGGSSPTRGQLGVSYSGRTFEERWVVIDLVTASLGPPDADFALTLVLDPAHSRAPRGRFM